MHLDILENWQQLEALAGEWNGLLSESGCNSLFLTWEWISAWKLTFECPPAPFVVTARCDAGQLVGVAPLYRSSYRLFGLSTYRALKVLGDSHTGAEYAGFIVHRAHRDQAMKAMLDYLVTGKHPWDFIWMSKMAEWHDTTIALDKALGSQPRLCPLVRERQFGTVKLPSDAQSLAKVLSKSQNYAIRRSAKRIADHNRVRIRLSESAHALAADLEALFQLHNMRWEGNPNQGMFGRDSKTKSFFFHFSEAARQRQWLRLYILEIEGRPQAAQLGYVYNNVYFQIQEGFDPRCDKGAGNYLRWETMKLLTEERVSEYDFLEGFTEHKRRWSAERRLGRDLLIWRKSLKTLPLQWKNVWPTGRYFKPVENP